MKRKCLIQLLICLFVSSHAQAVTKLGSDQTQVDYQVLFVGNSLTYTHNLPRLVRRHAAEQGISVSTTSLAKGGYAIIDHWAEGRVQQLIKSQKFDFVVIQQGPSSQQDGYDMLVHDGAKYARLCEENNTQLAYFMVWPAIAYYDSFTGVINNYTAGAQANNAILIPVGTIWQQYIDASGDYSYYGADGFHPSKAGSQRAAEIIVDSLFNQSVCGCQNQALTSR